MKAITPKELMGRLLNDTEEKYAPKEIYVKGPMELPLPRSRVSVIGTRRPTKEGIAEARAVSKMLTGNGVIVVSGLAAGIDEVSHQVAIAAGGKTVAVLGTPLDKTYPASNHRLQMDIMKNHLAVSRFPTGSPIARRNFVIRNRLMALISDASVIVEAGEGSGTLHHGWETLRLKAAVCMQPGSKSWSQVAYRDEAIRCNRTQRTHRCAGYATQGRDDRCVRIVCPQPVLSSPRCCHMPLGKICGNTSSLESA